MGPADPPTGAVVGIAATPSGDGYWLVAGDGSVYAFGDAGHYGSGREVLGEDDFVIGMAATPTGPGYWLLDVAGEVYAFGDAGRFGSLAPIRRNFPSVGMAATPTGRGYWILDADGSLSSFGDASFLGGPSPYYLGEMAAVEATPSGRGYWLATVDGPVKAYGDGAPVEVGTREVDFVIDLAANVRPFVPGPRAGTVEREGEGGLRMPADPCFNVPLQPPVRVPGAAPVPGVSGPHAAVGSAGANHFLGGADHPQTSVT